MTYSDKYLRNLDIKCASCGSYDWVGKVIDFIGDSKIEFEIECDWCGDLTTYETHYINIKRLTNYREILDDMTRIQNDIMSL